VSQKNILNIFDCNLKTNYQILIIFGTNILDTTCHQMTVFISHLTQCILLHYLGKADQVKYALKATENLKKHSQHYRSYLDQQILIIFNNIWQNYF